MSPAKLVYDCARLPRDSNLISSIASAAERLRTKLSALRVDALPVSQYNQRYLSSKLTYLEAELKLYSFILAWCLHKADVSLGRFTFVDYGGGIGVLAMLAKELGLARVIYTDIYSVSCQDARELGARLACEADHYLEGELPDLTRFANAHGYECHGIGSYDVLEHIYDIGLFFRNLSAVPGSSTTVMMGSGANPLNRGIRLALMKMHYEYENCDREPAYGHKARDTLRSFRSIRRELIERVTDRVSEKQLEMLVERTRGLMESDIVRVARRFATTGEPPPLPDHPTNTCDPYTGNWQERLMNPYWLAQLMSGAGFDARVLGGYYGCSSSSPVRRLAGRAANLMITVSGSLGLKIAPFYAVYGRKR